MLDPNGEDGESWLSRARDTRVAAQLVRGCWEWFTAPHRRLLRSAGLRPRRLEPDKLSRLDKGLAQLAVGVVETYGGSALVTGGAGLAGIGGIGEVGTGGAATPVAIPAIVVGAGAVTTGIVVVAHGGKNVLGGLTTLQNAMHNSEGPPSEPSPSTQSPSETPQPAPKPPEAPEVPKPATPNSPRRLLPIRNPPRPRLKPPRLLLRRSQPGEPQDRRLPATLDALANNSGLINWRKIPILPLLIAVGSSRSRMPLNAVNVLQSVIHPESSLRTHEGGRQQKVTVMWSHLRTFRTRIFTRPNTSSTTTAGETRSDHENDTPKRN